MSLTRIIKLLVIVLFFPVVTRAAADKEFVVMIDPGHGGKDAGALGQRTNEKTINLAVGKKLQKLINSKMKDAKAEMTRDGDYFITLKERPNIAKRKNADIFVSIHANSIDKKSPLHSSINGAAVYTLGLKKSDTNLSVAMRENAVMKLEADYSTTYEGFDPSSAESYIAFEMMQHSNMDQSIQLAEAVQNALVRTAGRANKGVRQAPFWVLVGTSMPAILVELDYICNPAMEKFMASEEGQDKLALAIYQGIERFRRNSSKTVGKKGYPTTEDVREAEESVAARAAVSDVNETSPATTITPKGELVYKIQFLTTPSVLKKNDSRLKGLSPVDYYKDGGTYKYTYGSYPSSAAAASDLKKVKKQFPDAFVIRMRDGKRVK
ncbi:MAG: N-acetylmuramoyl-L-alanine amidase [Duncaniella sp.]|uniref:N-acetylmuramoyl-L-alanine amidase family protein n=1 Tax=Duncaniella sp. TaxID=2518496 RepID=UPI0023C04937|nr:N-acetylmuramoyl-L-alanine amidase [Duncaniella sp.]MDE6091027.1 N-acetylmuramoyl-L-alanine amidase [Duncaniella sp.]